MNTLNIALKEMKSTLRDRRTFLFMLAFPIVLMLILGVALSNVFGSSIKLDEMKVLYKEAGADSALSASWQSFIQVTGQEGIRFEKAAASKDGQTAVRDGDYSAYAELRADGIELYASSKSTIEGNVVQGMLTAFVDRYKVTAAQLASGLPMVKPIAGEAQVPAGFIQETSLTADKKPGSLDYYALTMTTMIAMYAAMSASYLIQGERVRHTSIRLSAAPIRRMEIFVGKVLGSTCMNSLCILAVVLFSKFVFGANWGEHYGMLILILVTEVLLAVSLGLGLSFLFKGEGVRSFVALFAQIVSFIGGAYFPIDTFGNVFDWIPRLSPLRWANLGLTDMIYNHSFQAAYTAVGLNLGFAALCLTGALLVMRRRESF